MPYSGILGRVIVAVGMILGAGGGALAKRTALVIGNNAYRHLPTLEKAVNDADAVGTLLRQLGFAVTALQDLNDRATNRALAGFLAQIGSGDEVIVFFSGHGIAIDGRNYLLPVDLEEPEPGQVTLVTDSAMDAAEMVERIRMKRPKYVFAVFDACRNNPFKGESKSIGLAKGLVRMEANTDAFVLFAAGPGEQALDRLGSGDGSETSVFTRVFLKHLGKPGQNLQAIARATQREVRLLALTVDHRQFPDYSDRTVEDIVLAPAEQRPPASQLRETRLLSGHTGDVNAIAFSPDGSRLASAGDDRTVKLWDVATGDLLRSIDDHANPVKWVAFSPDGRMLVSASEDATAKKWDVGSGRLLGTFRGSRGNILPVAYAADGEALASTGDGHIELWNVHSEKLRRSFKIDNEHIWSMTFSTDSRYVAIATSMKKPPRKTTEKEKSEPDRNRVWLWDVRLDLHVRTLEGFGGILWSLGFSPDGTMLAVGGGLRLLELWDPRSGSRMQSLVGHTDLVVSIAFAPDGSVLASGSADNTVKLWDPVAGGLIRTLEGHGSDVNSVAFSPDGKMLASGSSDGTIMLWNITQWTAAGKR